MTFRSERGVFQSLSIDGKFFLSPRSLRVEPFLQAGMGFYGFYNTTFQSNRLKGFGLQLGGGVDIRLNRSIVLGGRLLYKAIFVDNFDDAYFGVPPESEVFNLFVPEINLQFHF